VRGERYEEYLERLEVEDWLLLAAVVLLPWAFGGVEVWAYRPASLLISVAAAVALFKRGAAGLGLGREARWLLPAFLLAGWAVVQIVPLPPPVVRLLSPQADRIYTSSLPGYGSQAHEDPITALEREALAEVPEAAGNPSLADGKPLAVEPPPDRVGWRSLSVQPYATQERLFWFVALLMAFLLARERTRDPVRARVYRTALFGLFALLAMFALVQAASWNGRMFWIGPAVEGANPFGPYVNFVHFGGVMEMAVPWLAGYAWTKVRRPEGDTLWRSIAPVAVGAAALGLIAAVASASKGAALLCLLSLVALGLVGLRGVRPRILFLASVLALAAIVAPMLRYTPLGERVVAFLQVQGESPLALGGRAAVLPVAFDVIGDFPLTGAGFGAFANVFASYTPPGSLERWEQLHNDYLEMVVDGGAIAAGLVLWLALAFSLRALRSVGEARTSGNRAEYLGLLLGIGALAVHAAFDFNHQIPGNALIWVVACGILLGRGRAGAEEAVS